MKNECPHCQAVLAKPLVEWVRCPQCGQSLRDPASASGASAITVQPDELTLAGTLDEVPPNLDIDKTMPRAIDATIDLSSSSASGTVQGTAIASASSDIAPSLASFAATLESIEATPGIGPGSTISVGPSGLTLGRSAAPTPVSPFTTRSNRGGATARKSGTQPDSVTNQDGISLESDSILSTISKRTLADGNATPSSTPPDYKIVSKLGEGGMGVVYSAIQKTLDRKVAIKAIKASKASSEQSRRKFFYEAQITSDLDHPNIVPIHDMGSNDDGTLFYSMKMVDGTPWEDVLLHKTREENLEIFMKICDAVAFAHSRNIIHRDLKPENVMLGTFGEVLVMDWGLAVDLNAQPTFGMSGTPVYMAPEMASHDLSKIGKASDIYILGAILFQIIVGRAPHKGQTVRECLANAAKNINIETNIVDPLLDIANHAMAMEPEDRFASVSDFQDAIREHLRFDQSVALTKRANGILESAIENQDYQLFSRALFSMQDAIDIWPGNENAKDGIHRIRLSYGQCALNRGDYDLCLQILNPTIPEEAQLAEQAKSKKASLAYRESRFKWMRRAIAALILFSGVSLTTATMYSWRQANNAMKSAESEKKARVDEEHAKLLAIDERNKAQQAEMDERVARENEALAKQTAQAERDRARSASEQERIAKEKAIEAQLAAVAAEKNAIASEAKAMDSEKEAVRNARFARLSNYQSQLNLSLNQSNQFDTAHSEQSLQHINEIEAELGNVTSLQNWAYRRVNLINNQDIPKLRVDGQVTDVQYSIASKRIIVGTTAGNVYLLKRKDEAAALVVDRTLQFPAAIQSVTLSSSGLNAMVAIEPSDSNDSVFQWKTTEPTASPVKAFGHRSIQKILIRPDELGAVAGINGGLWTWQSKSLDLEMQPTRLSCRGELHQVHFPGGQSDQVFGFAKLPNSTCYAFLASMRSQRIDILPFSEALQSRISTACMSGDLRHIYLGCVDGKILVTKTSALVGHSVATNQTDTRGIGDDQADSLQEILPQKHTTAIRDLQVHSDGTLMSYSDEPVVHLWKPKEDQSSLDYWTYVAGFPGNLSHARFLDTSGDLLCTDDRGNLMIRNVDEQLLRRMHLRSSVAQQVAQSVPSDGTLHCVDENGVLRVRANNDLFHFEGHTPGIHLTDIALSTSEKTLATVGRLDATSAEYTPGSNGKHELCVWDIASRKQIKRLMIDSMNTCRIAFTMQDRKLVVGDGKQTYLIPIEPGLDPTVEKRFGTNLSIQHPKNANLVALVSSAGAVRLMDLADANRWNDEGYRFLDLSIKNGFAPIEATWSTDGKRLYIVFEHGRIARLEWDGARLSNPHWSQGIPAIESKDQNMPWRHMDLETFPSNEISDTLKILVRNSESKPSSQIVELDWAIQKSEPTIVASRRVSGAEWLASPSERRGSQPNRASFNAQDIVSKSGDLIVAADQDGTMLLSPRDAAPWTLGRPKCSRASHDRPSKSWVTVHAMGVVLYAQVHEHAGENSDKSSNEDSAGNAHGNRVQWSRVMHPFEKVSQAELSGDGKRLAIVGQQYNSQVSRAIWMERGADGKWQWDAGWDIEDVRYCRWHPENGQLVVMNHRFQWSVRDPMDAAHASPIPCEHWSQQMQMNPDPWVDMQWLREPFNDGTVAWYLALQSRSERTSQIAFVPLDTAKPVSMEPIRSRFELTSMATSPTENLLAVGDAKGNLSLWFVSPSIDQQPRELFGLVGHRGVAVSLVSFSEDGDTILSSDISKRSIEWHSRKPLAINDHLNEKKE